jgi:membrane-associated phospholipid phosphatase
MTRSATLCRATAIVFSLGATPLAAGSSFEAFGDVMQIVLPGAAAVCAGRQDDLVPYSARLVGQIAVTQGLKYGLGDRPINQRPNGGTHGFPSGHTAAAFYGASYLANNCLQTGGQKAVAYGLAVAVGASRLHANQHDLAQVVAGALVGYMFDNVAVSFSGDRIGISRRYAF